MGSACFAVQPGGDALDVAQPVIERAGAFGDTSFGWFSGFVGSSGQVVSDDIGGCSIGSMVARGTQTFTCNTSSGQRDFRANGTYALVDIFGPAEDWSGGAPWEHDFSLGQMRLHGDDAFIGIRIPIAGKLHDGCIRVASSPGFGVCLPLA